MSDDLPRKHYPLSAVEEALNEPITVQQIVDYVAANALEQVKAVQPVSGEELFVRQLVTEGFAERDAELADLRSRIESLERAHGLIPGTSMHAAWKENE